MTKALAARALGRRVPQVAVQLVALLAHGAGPPIPITDSPGLGVLGAPAPAPAACRFFVFWAPAPHTSPHFLYFIFYLCPVPVPVPVPGTRHTAHGGTWHMEGG
jgi:hypothetical protein